MAEWHANDGVTLTKQVIKFQMLILTG